MSARGAAAGPETGSAGARRGWVRTIGFGLAFALGWWCLDRLGESPPMPVPALAALAAAATVLAVAQVVVYRTAPRRVPVALGFGRPVLRALAVAVLIGALVVGCYLGGAALLGIQLRLRPQWPLVLLGALVFHGLAEEMVWRGFTFARLRERHTFWRAVLLSMPLIALTHVPLLVTSGAVVGGVALLSALITCLPLSYLWERGGRTVWAPAIVHGLIGSWQIFERSYPLTFSLVVLGTSIVVPLGAFLFRDLFFRDRSDRSTGSVGGLHSVGRPGR